MRHLLLMAAIGAGFAVTCTASTITFTSLGTLSCGAAAFCVDGAPGDNQLTFTSTLVGGPSLTVTYNSGGDTQNAPPEVSANFGSILLACGGCTTANNAAWDLTGALGVITFNQTVPFAGSGVLSGVFSSSSLGWSGLSGISGAQTGTARFLFSPDSMNIIGSETISYTAEQPVNGTLLHLGTSTIQGLLDISTPPPVVPEPSTSMLVGLGVLGLGYLQRRRTARK